MEYHGFKFPDNQAMEKDISLYFFAKLHYQDSLLGLPLSMACHYLLSHFSEIVLPLVLGTGHIEKCLLVVFALLFC